MFRFICKTAPLLRHFLGNSPTYKLLALETTQKLVYEEVNQGAFAVNCMVNVCWFGAKRAISASNGVASAVESRKLSAENANQESFTVNYLINRCGFAPEKAISAVKYVHFDKADKPDAVISFLKTQGFTETQILQLATKYPPLVLCDPEKTLLPKIEFFTSMGFSKAHLARIFLRTPTIFKSSLERKIIPAVNFYMDLLGSVKDTIAVITQFPVILVSFQSTVAPNIEILHKAGVPKDRITSMLRARAQDFIIAHSKYKESVDKVEKMGFNPLMLTFVVAVKVISSFTTLNWQKKIEVYKRWGFSEDDVLSAFKCCPWCMATGDEKIEGIMEFVVNKMGWESSVLKKSPHIFSLSLNRRIIPRCSVYSALHLKGLIKRSPSLYYMLHIPESKFLNKFVHSYEKEAPELLNIYQEKLIHSAQLKSCRENKSTVKVPWYANILSCNI